MSPVIVASHLSKRYGKQVVLDGIDLDIAAGSIVGLIGPNGAGKTTTLKALLGLSTFDGDLRVLGLDPRSQRDELMQQVSFIADVAILPGWLKVGQAVDFVAGVHPKFNREKAERLLAKTSLNAAMPVRKMSKGMVTQLHLALVMAIDARLLVLDEPTLGLDILFRKQFYQDLIDDYYDEQKTIIISTHQVEEIEHVLTDLIFIESGRIVLNSSMEQLAERFIEVAVSPVHIEQAQALKPIQQRAMLGRTVMLFEDVSRELLLPLGELHQPGVADIFVAKMKGARQ